MPQVKAAFMDSQGGDQMGAAQASSTDEISVLDFDEFLECVARCGVDKYKGVKEMTPADGVTALMQNMLKEAEEEEEVVLRATYVHAEWYDAATLAKPLPSDGSGDFEKWMECWQRIEIMDMHHWPLWEDEVHDILQPLFKELQLIFLAYTRSISEDSAADAMEMDMGEFHDFVVDVGLETKAYKFDVMSNQFVKANATNVAEVRAQRQEEKRDSQTFQNQNKASWKGEGGQAVSAKDVADANDQMMSKAVGETKDQELVLYEFLAVLVRVAFWRANPRFGLWVDKDGDGKKDAEQVVPVAQALSTMLNERILPRARRENSATFRSQQMRDPGLLAVIKAYEPKLQEWWSKNVGKATTGRGAKMMLSFETWLFLLKEHGVTGEWEVEQLSAITGDEATKGNIKIRLSIPTCKAAFMDSQRVEQLGVGQAHEGSAQSVLDYDEFLECLARVATRKYSAIKELDLGGKLEGFLQNFLNEASEEDVMRKATYIHATRFDVSSSVPLEGESADEHAAFLSTWGAMVMERVYGFPTWEGEVHDLLHANYKQLASIHRAYSRSLGERPGSCEQATMSIDEFHDLVLDVGLETKLHTNLAAEPAVYTYEMMREQFATANKSGKGLAGPAADDQLTLDEFLVLLVRIAFHRLNPEYGELTMEHSETILPVPQCLERTLLEALLPRAQRDDEAEFREKVMVLEEVQAALTGERAKLQSWFNKLPKPAGSKQPDVTSWLSALEALGLFGSFSFPRTSDIVGDDRVHEVSHCRLSTQQAKLAFVFSQRSDANDADQVHLDFHELTECIARCGVLKFRAVVQMGLGAKVAAMVATVLGTQTDAQVVHAATHIRATRFEPDPALGPSKTSPSMSPVPCGLYPVPCTLYPGSSPTPPSARRRPLPV